MHAILQIRAVTTVPKSVANGMVRPGFATFSAGTVADSRPSNAQRASVALADTPDSEMLEWSKEAGRGARTTNNPSAAIAISGITFNSVVIACTQPAALTPYQLTKVSSQSTDKVTAAEAPGKLGIQGYR